MVTGVDVCAFTFVCVCVCYLYGLIGPPGVQGSLGPPGQPGTGNILIYAASY